MVSLLLPSLLDPSIQPAIKYNFILAIIEKLLEGYTERNIGEMSDLSESRISQLKNRWLKKCKEELN